MRSADEVGGISVYARNLVKELLEADEQNEYVLFYKSDKHLGTFSSYQKCTEILLTGRSKLLWDQWTIPRAVKKYKIDLIFNPKFTVPLFTSKKTAMTVHGADWFIPPYNEVYTSIDNLYIKTVMPLYFRKAAFISSVSDYSTDGFVNAFPWCINKIKTIYFGPNEVFKPISDQKRLSQIREKYDLPNKFLLTVIRYDFGHRNTRKNFKGMAEGYAKYKEMGGKEKFVVVGRDCHLYAKEYDLKAMGIEDDIVFTGLVAQEDLPAFYSLADLYLYPTIIEAFPIPTTEAMACGCPIVTSKGTGLEELTKGVSIAVDPLDSDAIGDAIMQVQSDAELKQRMIAAGFERSKLFSWRKCARETLHSFNELFS